MKHREAVLTLAAALLIAEHAAANSCAPPEQWLRWSYPDASTGVVPPDAVFRAFAYTQKLVTLELDGVALESTAERFPIPIAGLQGFDAAHEKRFSDPFGTSEFVPAERLSPGQHEVVIYVSEWGVTLETYRFQFHVEALPTPVAAPEVAHVTSYEWNNRFGGPSPEFYPPESEGGGCPGVINIAEAYCDTFSRRVPVVVELDVPAREAAIANGVLGYFVGTALVPLGCDTLYLRSGGGTPEARRNLSYATDFDGPVEVEALLPSGLTAPRTFTGATEVIHGERSVDFAEPPAWGCAMGGLHDNRHAAGAVWTLLVLAATRCARRRGRRAV